MARHAEIAGAGFAGLALGALLARNGWSVTVHERSPVIREIGAGIFLHNNGLAVLEDLGVMSALERDGVQLEWDRMVDQRGRRMQNRALRGESRVWSFPRQVLIEILHQAAIEHGVKVLTSSPIASASRDGALVADNGAHYAGDLVVGADGYLSKVRRSLGIPTDEHRLPTTSIRFLVPGRELTPEPGTTENWSGRRRVALAACGPRHTYVYMACPEHDLAGSTVPLDVASWSASFPRLGEVFALLHDLDAHKSSYSYVRTRQWSQGSAVLVGDAAHALAPTLGQGTNLALSNARSLATFLTAQPDIRASLRSWELAVRNVTDATQTWAGRYDKVTKYWPEQLAPVRAGVIWAFGASKRLNRQLRVADRTAPITQIRERDVRARAG